MSRGVLPWAFSLWWVVGLQGLAALILGILLLTVPEATAAFFWVAVGLYLFLYGMGTLFNALFHRQLHRSRWQWLGGLLSAVGGLVAISNPMLGLNLTATVLSYVVGVAAIISGFTHFVRLRQVDERGFHHMTWSNLITGVFKIGFGVLIMARPLGAGLFLLQFLGAWAVLGGLALLFLAYRLQKPVVI